MRASVWTRVVVRQEIFLVPREKSSPVVTVFRVWFHWAYRFCPFHIRCRLLVDAFKATNAGKVRRCGCRLPEQASSQSESCVLCPIPTMRAALRHLCQHGVEALKPQKIATKAVEHGTLVAKPSREVWRRPLLSKRVAKTVRKQAVEDGTYGSFDTNTGMGWDPSWDLVLHSHRYEVTRFAGIQPPKKTSRDRNREERARTLEKALEGREEAMEQYYTEKEESRVQDKSFEAKYKRMLRNAGTGR